MFANGEWVPDSWLQIPVPESVVFIDASRINVYDLEHITPGRIIRCKGNPHDAMAWIPPQLTFEHYGFIAGLASENP